MVTVVKLAGDTGALVWRREIDAAWRTSSIALDGAGDAFFAVSTFEPRGNDFGVVKVAGDSGQVEWIARESGSVDRWQEAARVATDPSGAVFAAGMTNDGAGNPANADGFVFTVVALDGATGIRRWVYHAPGTVGGGFATQLKVDSTGRVIAAGETAGVTTCGDAFIVALEPVQGRTVWSRTFDGTFTARRCRTECPEHGPCPPVDDDSVTGMALDSAGHLFVGLALLDRDGAGVRRDAFIRKLRVR